MNQFRPASYNPATKEILFNRTFLVNNPKGFIQEHRRRGNLSTGVSNHVNVHEYLHGYSWSMWSNGKTGAQQLISLLEKETGKKWEDIAKTISERARENENELFSEIGTMAWNGISRKSNKVYVDIARRFLGL